MRSITSQQREIFEAVRNASNAALVSTEFEGKDATVIAFVTEEDNGEMMITPVALLFDAGNEDDLGIMDRLTPPHADGG